MKGAIRKVLADHLPEILAERELSEREWRGAYCVATCRTAQQGTHVRECSEGHGVGQEAFNSCRHRSCPQCGWLATQHWIEQRQMQVPRCQHVHTIWTVPEVFNPLWAYNRRDFTAMMFRASWETVRTLMLDPQWCGALPGMLSVFQSWGDLLQLHPHIHALVTGGGVDGNGQWRDPRRDFVICARVAMPLFRGKMRAFLLEGLAKESLALPPGTTRARWELEANRQGLRKWNVRVEPPYTETGHVIRYMGAYLKCGPLSDRRVDSYDGQTVRIAHRHPQKYLSPTYELSGQECARRLLIHMPEPGLHTSRFYGLYHPTAKQQLATAQAHFPALPVTPAPAKTPSPSTRPVPHAPVVAAADARTSADTPAAPGTPVARPRCCGVCGRPLRVRVLIHGGQSPPARFRWEQHHRRAA